MSGQVGAGRVSILGMARTGLATANALAARGFDVLVSDTRTEHQLAEAMGQLDRRVRVVTGRNEVRPGDLVVISPGIRPGSPAFTMAHELGHEVVSDVELFHRLSPAPMLCVTGTDGKSTTAALLAAMCADAGLSTFLGGNIGVGIMEGLDPLSGHDVVVVEVSCFQLIHCPTLRPRVAVYTNIAEDHLDYHGSYEAYQQAKRLLMANLGRGDTLVLNADDPILASWPLPEEASVLWTSRRNEVGRGCWIASTVEATAASPARHRELLPVQERARFAGEGGGLEPRGRSLAQTLWFRDEAGRARSVCNTQDIRIPGPHNIENALAATAAALSFGIAADSIRATLAAFPGLEHRIEHVTDIQRISFYNDSKATNPHAAIPGLSAFGGRPVVAIVGGFEKGSDFSALGHALAQMTAAVVLIGQTAERIRDAVPAAHRGSLHRAGTLEEAVAVAFRLSAPGGVVTLCPACASFDMFADYEERGRVYKAIVRDLAEASARSRP